MARGIEAVGLGTFAGHGRPWHPDEFGIRWSVMRSRRGNGKAYEMCGTDPSADEVVERMLHLLWRSG